MSGPEFEGDISRVLEHLSAQIAGTARSTEERLTTLSEELRELRDTRMRPYMTSMGLFVTLVLGVTTYVYKVEMGFNRAVFALQDRMQDIQLRGELNRKQFLHLEERVTRMQERREATVELLVRRLNSLPPAATGGQE